MNVAQCSGALGGGVAAAVGGATVGAEVVGRVAGVGVAEIIATSDATKGSMYFHFPGGKEELAVEALRDGGTGDVGVALWAKKREGDLARVQRTTREMLAGPPSLAKVSVAAGALRDLDRA